MENSQPSMMDILIETHLGLERQGPGSPEATLKALGFIENAHKIERAADLGCGTGGQTMLLARHIAGHITGVDIMPEFIRVFNENAAKQNLRDRVSGLVGSMDALGFKKGELDLIWSEGAVDNIGFEKALGYWKAFLRKGGHAAVTSPSWFSGERPAELEAFWTEAGSALDTIDENVAAMQRAGYRFVAAFALPESCWTKHYFAPRRAAEKALLKKYAGSQALAESIEGSRREEALYAKYKRHYGYAFYVGQKL